MKISLFNPRIGVLLTVVVVFLNSNYSKAEVLLPSIFSSNMVLQQKSNVPLWGKAKAGSKVKIRTSWNNKNYIVNVDRGGEWKTFVETPPAGGPYSVTFDDGQKLALGNVLIGEVWVCSGQSNMEMPVKGFKNQPILNSSEILLEADNSQIRLIRYEKAHSRNALYDSPSTSWEVSDASSAKEFSAVWLSIRPDPSTKT